MTRRIATAAAFIGWIYCWYLFRGVRNEFDMGGRSLAPSWLLLTLVGTSTLLIGSAIAAGLKLKVWPAMVALGGLGMFASVVLAQYAVMRSFSSLVTLGDALTATFRTRSIAGALFISVVPAVLVVAGATAAIGPMGRKAGAIHA